MLTPSLVPRPIVRPLGAERYEIRFTAKASTRDMLRRAQDLLAHTTRRGDLAEIFDRALTMLVADLERKKLAAVARPRASRVPSADSHTIPAGVRRTVSVRDGGRCAFVAGDRRRCGERRGLEFHHVIPYGVGGMPTADNIALRCPCHNRYEAEVFYSPLRAYDVSAGDITRSGTGGGSRPANRVARLADEDEGEHRGCAVPAEDGG